MVNCETINDYFANNIRENFAKYMRFTCKNNNINAIKHMKNLVGKFEYIPFAALQNALQYNHLNILIYIIEYFNLYMNDRQLLNLLKLSTKKGNIDAIKYIISLGEPSTTYQIHDFVSVYIFAYDIEKYDVYKYFSQYVYVDCYLQYSYKNECCYDNCKGH